VTKKRVVIDYEKLPEETINSIKVKYPDGYEDNLITFTNKEGKYVSALPFETEEVYYLVRMTEHEARQIIKEDDDYDEDGKLRDDFTEDLKDADEEDSEEYLNDHFDEAANVKDESFDED
jgi:hypothetical protein